MWVHDSLYHDWKIDNVTVAYYYKSVHATKYSIDWCGPEEWFTAAEVDTEEEARRIIEENA